MSNLDPLAPLHAILARLDDAGRFDAARVDGLVDRLGPWRNERIDPNDETVVLTVRIARRDRDRLDAEASANGNTLSQHVRNLLLGYYEGDPVRLPPHP
jgi:hypothetical protein